MGPFRAPSYLSCERCSSSAQTWPASHQRTVATHAHGRGRRKSHRYVGVNPTQYLDYETIVASTSTSKNISWPLSGHKVFASPNEVARSACASPSARSASSDAGVRAESPPSASWTELQKKQLDDAAHMLLQALELSRDDSPVGRLLSTGCRPLSTAEGPASASAATALGHISRADVTAAASLLPPLAWQWLSVADLDGWVGRGVVQLLREALLVQRASSDASASINELVGWCLDNCCGPAVALAAVWGQQQAQALTPRCRSFYALLMQRLGPSGSQPPQQQQQHEFGPQSLIPARRAAAAGPIRSGDGGLLGMQSLRDGGSYTAASDAASMPGQLAPIVCCGSVARTTALSRAFRSRSQSSEVGDEGEVTVGEGSAGVDGQRGGGGGDGQAGSGQRALQPGGPTLELGVPGSGPGASDLVGELPAAARALLQHAAAPGAEDGADGEGEDEGAGGGPEQERGERELQLVLLRGPPPRGANGTNSTTRAPNGVSNISYERSAVTAPGTEAAAEVRSPAAVAAGELGREGYSGGAPLGRQAAGGGDEATDAAALARSPAASGAVVGRPTAALLQRPSRGLLAPEPDLDPLGLDGGSASSSMDWYTRGGAPSSKQSVIAVRLVATGPFPVRDLSGAVLLDGVLIPESGPVVISNDPRVFPGTEAVLSDYPTAAGDKLAMRLEYIVDRSLYDQVVLQLFNISRVTRKRTDNCLVYINGKPVNVGDPGVPLAPGDEIWFGNRTFSFRLEALQGPPSAVQEALHRFCSLDDAVTDDSEVTVVAAGFASEGGESSSDEQPYAPSPSASWSPTLSSDMAELSNLSRRDPLRAESALRQLAAANPGDAAVWLIWAQTAARMEGPGRQAKARLLFRAAAEAARRMEIIPPPPPALQIAAQRAMAKGGRRRGPLAAGAGGGGGDVGGGPAADTTATGSDLLHTSLVAAATAAQRHNWLLVQALGNWGKHEWRLRMYGSARHLFRAAVNEAAKHPDGVAGGGGAAILHYWASRELDALNVRNARIVAAEALRKCPGDVALNVLAAGVELEGGNLELAKSYCQRAYSLDRTDKQLFLVWPRVEAALGDRLKARLLYERALDMYPLNTKILNLYARFEAEEGSYREAAELYDRALRIDPLSPVMGVHNRADWASLEADLGNTELARLLLEGGLLAHPRAPPLLVTLSKVERLEGRYLEALRLVRTAQALAGPFNAAVMTERSQVLRAMGEREMAANLARHVAAVKELNRMKQQGYWGSEAWRAFIEATRSSEQQALVAAAHARRRHLGWAPAVRGAKPQPTGQAGDGRRAAAPAAQQWLQLEQLRIRRAEVRRLAAERAARMRAQEQDGGDAAAAVAGMAGGGSMSSGDDDYDDYYDEPSVGVPSLDAVRRPMPGDDDVYES